MIRPVRWSLLVAALAAGALSAPAAWANHGAPLSTFGSNGTSIVDLAGGGEAINDLIATTVPILAPAPSGFPCGTKNCAIVTGFRTVLLAAGVDRTFGDSAFAIERYDANGILDPSFGAGGKVRTPFEAGQSSAAGLAVMPDGRFVVAGDIDIGGSQGVLVALARYRPDGTLDPTFSGDGKVNAQFPGAAHYTVSAVALQSDGRIVVGGTVVMANGDSAFGLMRFTADGALDTTFGSTQRGVETTTSPQQFNTAGNHAATLNDIIVDPLDRIVAVGDMAIFGGFRVLAAVRYVARGVRNADFTSDGIVTLDVPGTFVETAEAVVRQSDGKLVLGGWGNVRLSDGRIRSRMIAARFTDLGALDTTFTSNGFSVDQLAGEGFYETHALFYDPQAKTILAGGFARPDAQSSLGDQFAFIRYSQSGFPDTLFNGTGRMLQNLTPQADHVNAIVSEVGGTLVAGGYANDSPGTGSSMLALGGYHGAEDRLAPRLRGTIVSRRLRAVEQERRLGIRVVMSEAGAVRITARLRGGRALGAVDVAFGAAGKRTVKVRLTAAGRRALHARRRARIVVRLAGRDVHGNRTTRSVRRTLR
jgi:uncharacterized delta-60 repeat protein